MASQHEPLKETIEVNHPHSAGAFDIRNFIGVLIGIYGIVLIACSFLVEVAPDTLKRSSDNLWAGLAMLLCGIFFIAWARIRPIIIDDTAIHEEQ